MNRYVWLLLVCIAIIIGVYCCNFVGQSISDQSADWGTFGDYIGGCCNVVVALLALFIMRNWEKRDKQNEKSRAAIEEIFEQICKIRNNRYNANMVNKLIRDVESGRLFISNSLYDELIELANYFLSVNNCDCEPDPLFEDRIISRIKDTYDK